MAYDSSDVGIVMTTADAAGYVVHRIPTVVATYTEADFVAASYVKNQFQDSQTFAEEVRTMALEMMTSLQDTEGMPGLSLPDRKFPFDAEPPSVSDLTVPEPPQFNQIPGITRDIPNVDGITPPVAQDIAASLVFDNDVIYKLKEKLLEDLKAPGGYSSEVEQGIYDRARTRREADLQEKKNQASSTMAKRGFPAPPGALNAALRRYDVEDHREETNLNRDIVQQQAELARQKYEFLMQTGVNIDAALRERAVQEAQTAMEKARLQMQFALDIFSSKLRKAEIQSTVLQTEAQVRAEQARVESLKFDAYSSQIQGVQSKAELERVKAQIFSEKRQAQSDQYSLQLENDRNRLGYAQALQDHRRSIAESAANIASQLAASAMTAVSTSAQVGASQNESKSQNYSTGVTRSDGIQHNYSLSA